MGFSDLLNFDFDDYIKKRLDIMSRDDGVKQKYLSNRVRVFPYVNSIDIVNYENLSKSKISVYSSVSEDKTYRYRYFEFAEKYGIGITDHQETNIGIAYNDEIKGQSYLFDEPLTCVSIKRDKKTDMYCGEHEELEKEFENLDTISSFDRPSIVFGILWDQYKNKDHSQKSAIINEMWREHLKSDNKTIVTSIKKKICEITGKIDDKTNRSLQFLGFDRIECENYE